MNGAGKKKRRLHFVTAEDGLFHCPVKNCDHHGFITQSGCRKHVKKVGTNGFTTLTRGLKFQV